MGRVSAIFDRQKDEVSLKLMVSFRRPKPNAPGGASRCRAFASCLMGRSAVSQWSSLTRDGGSDTPDRLESQRNSAPPLDPRLRNVAAAGFRPAANALNATPRSLFEHLDDPARRRFDHQNVVPHHHVFVVSQFRLVGDHDLRERLERHRAGHDFADAGLDPHVLRTLPSACGFLHDVLALRSRNVDRRMTRNLLISAPRHNSSGAPGGSAGAGQTYLRRGYSKAISGIDPNAAQPILFRPRHRSFRRDALFHSRNLARQAAGRDVVVHDGRRSSSLAAPCAVIP